MNVKDLYAEVTAKIVAEMEAGSVPWLCPWKSTAIARARGEKRFTTLGSKSTVALDF